VRWRAWHSLLEWRWGSGHEDLLLGRTGGQPFFLCFPFGESRRVWVQGNLSVTLSTF
jgi:hypothetical protein